LEVIAEIGWNFMGDLTLAEEMISKASNAGADVVKFQYWSEKKLKPGVWDNDGRREIYKKAELSEEKILSLMDFCKQKQIEFLISCFNKADASYLKGLDVKRIKIPSHEVANRELHEYSAKAFEKCYVSLGAGTRTEIDSTIDLYNSLSENWVGMHCISSYPCPMDKVNLGRLNYLKDKVKTVGFSDHTSETITCALARMLGAEVFEKHFTSDKNLPGRDNKFALECDEFEEMCNYLKNAESALKDHGLGESDLEKDTINNYRGRWG